MDPMAILDNLIKELGGSLQSLGKAQTIEEKLAYSQIVKNLCQSFGVFLQYTGLIEEDEEED